MKVETILFLLTVGAVLAHDHHGHQHGQRIGKLVDVDDEPMDDGERELKTDVPWCGTKHPDPNDWNAFYRAQEINSFIANVKNADVMVAAAAAAADTPRIIPVCFHVPQKNRTKTLISNADLQAQLDLLNRAYTNTSCCNSTLAQLCGGQCSVNIGVQFVMAKWSGSGNTTTGTVSSTSDPQACIRRPVGAQWMRLSMSQKSEFRIKKALRIGDQRTLNVYFIPIFDSAGRPPNGFATLPWYYLDDPDRDGVVMQPRLILDRKPNVLTLPHEVGHWLGLFHTFDGGCDGGDGIPDTAPEAIANFECNSSTTTIRDTCPGDASPDPIFNFMDYSQNSCIRFQFTPGQAAQIRETVDMYRASAQFPNTGIKAPITLTDGVKSRILTASAGDIFQFTIRVPTESTVHCAISGRTGDLDLFMNWDGRLVNFDCTGESDILNESCDIGPKTGTAYAYVYAVTDAMAFRVKCSLY